MGNLCTQGRGRDRDDDVCCPGQGDLPKDLVAINPILTTPKDVEREDVTNVGRPLLPGLPDDVTLNLIASKLPWSAFHTLSSVSGAWRHAIRTRVVYDVRVRSRSTETLFCFTCRRPPSHIGGVHRIALYSMRDASCSLLPPITETLSGVPENCQTISLDKMYILGGGAYGRAAGSHEVYVCDLAEQGRRQWKRCASMKQGRLEFGCGVLNGKIYVFGGLSNFHFISASEVYDPKEISWSSVKPMADPRFGHVVETVGDEFVVIGGYSCHNPNLSIPTSNMIPQFVQIKKPEVTAVYHPAENKWRVGKFVPNACVGGCTRRCARKCTEKLFVARGELYFMGLDAIHIHNAEEDAWTLLHTFSFMSSSSSSVEEWDIQVVDDEVVIRFFWIENAVDMGDIVLLKAKGLVAKEKSLFGST